MKRSHKNKKIKYSEYDRGFSKECTFFIFHWSCNYMQLTRTPCCCDVSIQQCKRVLNVSKPRCNDNIHVGSVADNRTSL